MVVSKKGVYEPRLARIEDLDTNITWITAAAWPHRRQRPHAQSSHAQALSSVSAQYSIHIAATGETLAFTRQGEVIGSSVGAEE